MGAVCGVGTADPRGRWLNGDLMGVHVHVLTLLCCQCIMCLEHGSRKTNASEISRQ